MNIFGAIQAFFSWMAISAEIKARRLLIEELEKCEDEKKRFEGEVQHARATGKHGRADWMLARCARRACLESRILDIGEGAVMGSPEEGDAG